MKIYLLVGEEQRGPYAPEAISKMISAKEVTLETLYWEEGMTEWQPVGKRTDLRPAPVTIAPPRRPRTEGASTVDFKDTLPKKEILSARRAPLTIATAFMALILFFGFLTLVIYVFGRALPNASKDFEEKTGYISSHK
jgi:hypothetical protein